MTTFPRFSWFFLAVFASLSAAAQNGPPREDRPFREPDLVEIVKLDPGIHLDIRYATANNLVGRAVYAEARAFLQRPAAEALVRVNRALKEKGYGLLVFDGYRPWSVTVAFWDATPDDKKIFVANPKNGSRHNRGCAVDLSLYELASGREAEMGGTYDEMSERSYPTYDKGPKDALRRRDLLSGLMEKEGFSVYPAEWWHFDYKDWRDYPLLDVPFAGLRAPRAAFSEVLNLRQARVVDLTHPSDEKTLHRTTASSARELIAPAVVLDVAGKAEKDRDYRLTAADVQAWEAAHGTIPKGAIVLLRTGWSSRWPDRLRYVGDSTLNDASHLHFPSYGADAAEFLVRERSVSALGVDTASIDFGPSLDFPVRRILAAAQVTGLENLTGLGELPDSGAWIVALPMKTGGDSGDPVRAVALVGN
jgi:zinc D-Ala-D-Ala dipeptidase